MPLEQALNFRVFVKLLANSLTQTPELELGALELLIKTLDPPTSLPVVEVFFLG